MKRKRHSRTDILARIGEVNADLAAGVPPAEVCAKHEITLQTLRRWLREHASAGPDDEAAPRVKTLEGENQRLRRAVARLEMEKRVLLEAVRGNY